MRLYNTMSRSIEEFVPINKGKVSMYCCGPTVYNYAHIGNLRTYIFEDLLRRTLRRSGYDVKHVMNITDVGHLTGDGDDGEDKMEKSARETGRTVWDIAEFYMKAFFRDEEALNIERPDIICRATEHIDDMINLIKRLEEGGHTYISGGNVYFSIDSISDYGKLARLNLDDLKSGARIEVDSNKKNPKGWHIECSAMSMKYLGEHFDIHCGGIDAIPVHHTNEIAQSEAATGKTWVNYWCHGEFLLMGNAKMSKSSGSFVTLPVLEGEGYDALDYRYFCLTGHYRSQLRFSYEALDAARSARKGIMERIADAKSEGPAATDPSEKAREYMAAFDEAMENDLNAPKALSILWQMLKDNGLSSSDKLAAAYHMDGILGLGLDKAEKKEETLDAELQALLDERTAAKKAKDYKKADEIRDKLLSMGYAVKDTPAGPVLQKM